MSSIAHIENILENVQTRSIAVNQSSCVSVRNRNAGCQKCVDACPAACITLENNRIVINAETCQSCGACMAACPTNSLMMPHSTNAQLEEDAASAVPAADGDLIVVCQHLLNLAKGQVNQEKIVTVPCLSRINESMLVTLALQNQANRIVLTHGPCVDCECIQGKNTAHTTCKKANALFEAWNSPVRAQVSKRLPAHTRAEKTPDYDRGRREFFTEMRQNAKTVANISAEAALKSHLDIPAETHAEPRPEKVNERGVLPQNFPEQRAKLIAELDKLGEPQENAILDNQLWATVEIDINRCKSCRMCATFCPTGALFKFSTNKGNMGVKHRARQCIACGCCESICPAQALTLKYNVPASSISNAKVSRFVLPPLERTVSKPTSIRDSLRTLMGIDNMYER